MTDGIIQELFNPIINILNSRMARITYSPKEVENIIKGLKKELIEKIKQKKIEISDFTWSGYSDGVNSLVEELIGDNQE